MFFTSPRRTLESAFVRAGVSNPSALGLGGFRQRPALGLGQKRRGNQSLLYTPYREHNRNPCIHRNNGIDPRFLFLPSANYLNCIIWISDLIVSKHHTN